ncbi:SpoVR family protein [Pelobacter seleniigenes]|uniref:SpoVR family protein n=1 Tax=Pelobacter seleniigenes TaxID=407188 RepID=UPI0004A75BAE|nr:SpoVR family protein [Pelobacter seleniigenes]
MQLIDQKTKHIMEGCKERARSAGLRFQDETLEYIVSNRDMIELMQKNMIPTLYDYWVHDVEVLKEKGKYELYPSNPYETVINTRPAISFYNDNNPDWLNVMIFYHVLAHIDFFQNNLYFQHTWDYDLAGKALADKRLITRLRSEHGRWVDYVIEFARGIDNLVAYHSELSRFHKFDNGCSKRVNYYFDVFLQQEKKVSTSEYVKRLNRYNECLKERGELGEDAFFAELLTQHPEFDAAFEKYQSDTSPASLDLLQFLIDHSPVLNRNENKWMKSVLEIVRTTSIYFQPQVRTKIMNEGWASYWHEQLFLQDDRINGHEVDFARVNAAVTAMPKMGLNPYALGLRLFNWIEAQAQRGCYSMDYQRLQGLEERRHFSNNSDQTHGRDFIFKVREDCCDFTFINSFVDQEFIDHNKLFVAGRRLNRGRMVWEYYVRSRKADSYRNMLYDSLYHPPKIEIVSGQGTDGALYLRHRNEGKPLVQEYIANTMLGIEFLWGGPVKLETEDAELDSDQETDEEGRPVNINWSKVLYNMHDRKLTKERL